MPVCRVHQGVKDVLTTDLRHHCTRQSSPADEPAQQGELRQDRPLQGITIQAFYNWRGQY
jgi:hypothetical protein